MAPLFKISLDETSGFKKLALRPGGDNAAAAGESIVERA
jgi:hypothetical protein